MIPTEIDRLANALNALRPDWPTPSLRTWITNNLAQFSWRVAATVAVNAACDPLTDTPARILERGPWWQTIRPTATGDEPPPYYRPAPTADEPNRLDKATVSNYATQARQAIRGNQP